MPLPFWPKAEVVVLRAAFCVAAVHPIADVIRAAELSVDVVAVVDVNTALLAAATVATV